jgi:hypothetical protein
MHNIGNTNPSQRYSEYASEYAGEMPGQYEGEFSSEYAGEVPGEYAGEYAAGEYAGEYAGEMPGEAGEYAGEYAGEFGNESESFGEFSHESLFSEAEEMELASELLNVSSEAELEQFFGSLFKKAAGFLKSGLGKQLGGALKNVVKTALPMAGVLGNLVLPGVGGMIGGQLASTAGSMLGLELEGLSNEDQEFEVARQIVRLGAAAASNAAQAHPAAPPAQVAHEALSLAAQQYAPGFLRNVGDPYADTQANTQMGPRRDRCSHRSNGRWIRRGHSIILFGI